MDCSFSSLLGSVTSTELTLRLDEQDIMTKAQKSIIVILVNFDITYPKLKASRIRSFIHFKYKTFRPLIKIHNSKQLVRYNECFTYKKRPESHKLIFPRDTSKSVSFQTVIIG